MNHEEIREFGENVDMYLHYVANLIKDKEEIGVEVVGQLSLFADDLYTLAMALNEMRLTAQSSIPADR